MSQRHVALVTGAGRGIGAAIALRLAREGLSVFAAARSQEACVEVADQIIREGGVAWPLYLDVGDQDSIDGALREVTATLSETKGAPNAIDWLVNNAGIAISAPFLDHRRSSGIDLYEQHLQVNFHGARRMIEALAPAMIAKRYGRIVNIASSAGLKSYAYAAAYCASKHALVGYSRSAAAELARKGVTLNLVCPHYVDSPMTDGSVARMVQKTGREEQEIRRFLAAENPGGTLVAIDEVAEAVSQLLSGEKNGAIVELVGGRGVKPLEQTMVWH